MNLLNLVSEYGNVKNPYNFKTWWILINTERQCSNNYFTKVIIFESALKYLPTNYKLWFNYLSEAKKSLENVDYTSEKYLIINRLFERALIYMNKMPRIWMDYIEFLIDQNLVSKVRRTFDRALENLPLSQHIEIWDIYLDWSKSIGIPSLIINCYQRYLKINNSIREDFIKILIELKKYSMAIVNIIIIINEESCYQRTEQDYWYLLSDIISFHSFDTEGIEIEDLLKHGLNKYAQDNSKLWISLANYNIKQGNLIKARSIFEQAIEKTTSKKDFVMIYNCYLKLEEQLIDEEKSLFRLNSLVERQPFLLSDLNLRINKNNVIEWIKRAELCKDKDLKSKIYIEAIDTVDTSIENAETLYINFSNHLENSNEIELANKNYYNATKRLFKSIEAQTNIWLSWVEMHCRIKNFNTAKNIIKKACSLYTNIKLYNLFVDIEETIGEIESVIEVYEKMIRLKIANLTTCVNFCLYLEEKSEFDYACRIYEQALTMFTWPNIYDLWLLYITKYIAFYPLKKERHRDLFEQVISQCPAANAKTFYYMYSQYEEDKGSINNSIKLLEKCSQIVIKEEKIEIWSVLISKVVKYKGLDYSRLFFSKALESLEYDQIPLIGLKFATIEQKLGEIDRSRAIYYYVSQFCSPLNEEYIEAFWNKWEEFELYHGNKNTYKEMLKHKKQIANNYSLNDKVIFI